MAAVKVLKQSAVDGIEPNTITYSTSIEACARTGHLDVAVEVFREMLDAGMRLLLSVDLCFLMSSIMAPAAL
jgi:pentatricopeptide repeat protein